MALTPPTVSGLTFTKLVTVTVIRVPPRWLPVVGLTAVTVGAGVLGNGRYYGVNDDHGRPAQRGPPG